MDRRQVVFFDGIRHAAEIADLAYGRLAETLTALALTHHEGRSVADQTITSAFLDGWAFVDAVDRFRSLVDRAPGLVKIPPPAGTADFHDLSAPIRSLRNVADHLATRVDYVIARGGAALGCMKWLTVASVEEGTCLCVVLLPGTVQAGSAPLLNPLGRSFRSRTDHVHLIAGEYEASLSDVYYEMRDRVSVIEKSLTVAVESVGLAGQQAGADIVLAVLVKLLSDEEGRSDTP